MRTTIRSWRSGSGGPCVQSDRVFKIFRSRFIGKVSPVHFFWGSFDLAVTRFSGRTAPPPGGATPNVADWVMAEAYSHEVSSCGFWPGNGGYGTSRPSTSMPIPSRRATATRRLITPEAFYDKGLGQFILPYDAVRQSADPTRCSWAFCKRPTQAAATRANWDRQALERASAPAG